MRRRTLIASTAGVLAGLAGCLDGSKAGSGSPSPTETPTATPDEGGKESETATATAADVTVEAVTLQSGYVTPTSPDSIGVEDGDQQYLVAAVTVDGSLPRDAFTLEIGSETVTATTTDRFYRTDWGDDQWYEAGRASGLLLFRPTLAADGDPVALTWPGGEYEITGSIPDRLGLSSPDMTATFDLPETVAGTTAPSVEVSVTNDGDRERRFLGALNRSGPWVAFTPLARPTRMIEPGETVTVTIEDSWYAPNGGADEDRIGDGDPDLTYHLHYAGGPDTTHDVRLVESKE